MSKIRIYSKKAFAIGPGAQQGNPEIELFVTVPNAFQDMPEKYMNDPTFKLACSVGDITVINKVAQVASAAVVNTDFDEEDEPKAKDNEKLISEFYEKVKAMNAEEVKKLCEEYNAEFNGDDKLKENKKRLMEAYKLTLDSDN